tara:strand:- start:1951 stop:2211 length:261 start_codon:yes stop_codon:yes gene_type:complete
MPEAYAQLRPIKVVKDQYLYKRCKGCDKVKAIEHFSQTRKIDNLIYTHGKCKICRASQGRVYFNEQRRLMQKGKELQEQEGKEQNE